MSGVLIDSTAQPLLRYTFPMLLPDPLPADPMAVFKDWFDDATARQLTDNPNALVLSTVDVSVAPPRPSARVVLCKGMDIAAGYINFYTNYTSRKGRELAGNPRCSAVFHWDNDERQVRMEGVAVRSPAAESDAYFASRHAGSRVGAWASKQSQPLDARAELVDLVRSEAQRFGVPLNDELEAESVDVDIPRPDHWGGYRLWVASIELWVGGSHRVHDRARFERDLHVDGESVVAGDWQASRLFP